MFSCTHLLRVAILTFALATVALGQTVPADCSEYASVPLPAEAQKAPVPKTPPNCASYRSYRGIGRSVKYSEARACAWQERLAQKAELGQNANEPIAWVVGGSLILADIYANGAGVKHNIPLAMRFACEFGEGAALALRDLAKRNGESRTTRPFELCDYGVSTFTMNFCSDYEAEIADERKSRYYDSLRSLMTREQQAAFDKLLAAENAYIAAHASEVDQGGTIRVMRTLGSQNIVRNLFHAEIVHFERKKWPALSENQITNADALLHREVERKLQQLRSRPKEETYEGAVTAGGLSKAEEAWEKFRDAWAGFARLRYPAAVSAIRAQITLDRYRLVKTIN